MLTVKQADNDNLSTRPGTYISNIIFISDQWHGKESNDRAISVSAY